MVNAPYEINESCTCGATFNMTGSNYGVMAKALKEFREGHDHNPVNQQSSRKGKKK